MRGFSLENIDLNITVPNVKDGLDKLENKVEELSRRKSEKYKLNLTKYIVVLSIALFVVAYATTPDIEDFENEIPVGITNK